jgi:hypothetical protein
VSALLHRAQLGSSRIGLRVAPRPLQSGSFGFVGHCELRFQIGEIPGVTDPRRSYFRRFRQRYSLARSPRNPLKSSVWRTSRRSVSELGNRCSILLS